MSYKNYFFGKLKRLNWSVLVTTSLIMLVGAVSLYSAADGDFYQWSLPHIYRYIIGFFAAIAIAVIPWHIWRSFSYFFYLGGIILLLMVDVFGHIGMGAQRWLNLAGFHVQPSELIKISLVMAMARFYSTIYTLHTITRLIISHFFILLPMVFVLRQPDLGTAIILLVVGLAILFIAGEPYLYFISGAVGVLASGPILWNLLHDYQKKRIFTFFSPESDPSGSGYHIIQSKIAMGSGGFFGQGFMKGSQNHLKFLPEKQTDFIFSMIAEEWGFVGSSIIIFLYSALFYQIYKIIRRQEKEYVVFLCLGLLVTMSVYTLVNMGMVSGLLPIVGVPLPLLSSGGTSTLTMMMMVGLVLSADLSKKARFF